jgi:hypothetical protein
MPKPTLDIDDGGPRVPWWRPILSWREWLFLIGILVVVWFASKPFSARNQLHASANSNPTLWQSFGLASYDDELHPVR